MADSRKPRVLTPESWGDVGVIKKHDVKVIESAKDRARGDLDLAEWMKQGYAYDTRGLQEPKPLGHMPMEHASKLSVQEFQDKYEKPNMPVVIAGCADKWPGYNGAWQPKELMKHYRHRRFRCGEDDDGYPVKMKLKYFLRYTAEQRDDSPLYIFDSMFDQHARPCPIRGDYEVPPYFTEDLFAMVGEHRRPPYRWFLVGPKRSGTGVHVDPLATSAWNTLIYGRKRWVLFDPSVPKAVAKGRDLVRKDRGEDDEPVDYFTNILPRIKERGGEELTSRMIEFVQHAGETIFVPGGWWHAVLNLDDTIAVTQNFCSTANFERVWAATREGRRGMARKFLRQLRTARPDLAAVADRLNAEAGWDPAALAAKHRARKAAKAEKLRKREEARKAREAARAARSDSDSDSDSSSDSSSSSSGGSSSSGSVTSDSSKDSADEAGSGGMMGGGAGAGAGASAAALSGGFTGGGAGSAAQPSLAGHKRPVSGGASRKPQEDATASGYGADSEASASASAAARARARKAEAAENSDASSSTSGSDSPNKRRRKR